MLKHPRSDWPAILAAGLAGNLIGDLVMGDALATAMALTFCNAVGLLIVSVPLNYFGFNREFARPKSLCVKAVTESPRFSAFMAA